MNISNLIKQKRIQKNMTMEELALLLGVNQSTITRWETGNIKKIRPDKAPLLAKYLEIPLETLISEKNQKFLEESTRFLNKNNNYTNCIIQDGMNNIQINSTSHTVSKINDYADQLTDEGKEELLHYAEYLLRKYKK
jgi:transcriptional regulator with XRE-family HTH domain